MKGPGELRSARTMLTNTAISKTLVPFGYPSRHAAVLDLTPATLTPAILPASGGYPWTVIRVEDRDDYLATLESASVGQKMQPLQNSWPIECNGPWSGSLADSSLLCLSP